WEQVEGGPKIFLGWYDTKIGAYCTIKSDFTSRHATESDSFHCIPRVGDAGYFADAACTVRYTLAQCGERWALAYPVPYPPDASSCDAKVQPFTVGSAVSPTNVYYLLGTTCMSGVSDPAPGVRYAHDVGDALPLDTFVGGVYSHEGGSGRIVPL